MVQLKQVDKYNNEYSHEAAAMWFVYMLRLMCAGRGAGEGRGGQVATKDK